MVDCDWTGSCIPNTVLFGGRTVTVSGGGVMGEALTGSGYAPVSGRDVARPPAAPNDSANDSVN